jgi:hypothetical protein
MRGVTRCNGDAPHHEIGYIARMSETEIITERDAEVTVRKQRGVPFKPGQSGNPAGRPRGSRNRLADQFITDLREVWEKQGIEALQRCAADEPAQFVRVVASLMPKDFNINIGLDAEQFAQTFRHAQALLGNDVQQRPMRVINGRHR